MLIDKKQKRAKEQRKRKKRKKAGKGKRGLKMSPRRIWKVLSTFRLRELVWQLDTGDYVTNAYLYPLFHFLRGRNRMLQVNYQDHNEFKLVIENRLYRILYAFIR